MTKKSPKDINQIAHFIADRAANPPPKLTPEEDEARLRSEAAKMLGRLGGLRGGPARAEKLSARRRKDIAKAAIKERWKKYRAALGIRTNKDQIK
ncbi:MAG: hypothetical protein HY924_10910 [Elusimicrobia bacterium]|nr:hypothetical protein [Elusimicrobiota bacterium]